MLDMEITKPKKMAFTIENLAKSSRNDSVSEEAITFPNLPPIGFAPRIQMLDNFTPVKLQATVTPVMSTPKPLSKRKRNHSEVSETDSTTSSRSKSSEESTESFGIYPSDSEDGSDSAGRRKKARTAFTNEQICALEKRYDAQKYLPANERSHLAAKLKLSDQQVKTWFQNRRMKEKRQQRDDEHSRSFMLPTGGVDISQLVAMGMPCPPPQHFGGNNFLPVSGYYGKLSVPQQPSPMTTYKLPSPLAFYGSPYTSSLEKQSSILGQSF